MATAALEAELGKEPAVLARAQTLLEKLVQFSLRLACNTLAGFGWGELLNAHDVESVPVARGCAELVSTKLAETKWREDVEWAEVALVLVSPHS